MRTVTVTDAQSDDLSTLARAASNAAIGDSNDAEIDALREALEYALGVLGMDLPEPDEGDDA